MFSCDYCSSSFLIVSQPIVCSYAPGFFKCDDNSNTYDICLMHVAFASHVIGVEKPCLMN